MVTFDPPHFWHDDFTWVSGHSLHQPYLSVHSLMLISDFLVSASRSPNPHLQPLLPGSGWCSVQSSSLPSSCGDSGQQHHPPHHCCQPPSLCCLSTPPVPLPIMAQVAWACFCCGLLLLSCGECSVIMCVFCPMTLIWLLTWLAFPVQGKAQNRIKRLEEQTHQHLP